MTATAETLRKLDSLSEQDFNMIVSLTDLAYHREKTVILRHSDRSEGVHLKVL